MKEPVRPTRLRRSAPAVEIDQYVRAGLQLRFIARPREQPGRFAEPPRIHIPPVNIGAFTVGVVRVLGPDDLHQLVPEAAAAKQTSLLASGALDRKSFAATLKHGEMALRRLEDTRRVRIGKLLEKL